MAPARPAAIIARAGCTVLGVDISQKVVDTINRGEIHIEEVDLDDLNPESLWKFKIKNFGPLLVAMDSHGGNLYTKVNDAARDRRASVLAALGVKA